MPGHCIPVIAEVLKFIIADTGVVRGYWRDSRDAAGDPDAPRALEVGGVWQVLDRGPILTYLVTLQLPILT